MGMRETSVCDGHAASFCSISLFEFPGVGITLEGGGSCALRDISTKGNTNLQGFLAFSMV